MSGTACGSQKLTKPVRLIKPDMLQPTAISGKVVPLILAHTCSIGLMVTCAPGQIHICLYNNRRPLSLNLSTDEMLIAWYATMTNRKGVDSLTLATSTDIATTTVASLLLIAHEF